MERSDDESSSPVTLNATDESSSAMTLKATDESSSPVTLKATDESSSPMTLNATDESSSAMTLKATDESSSPVTLKATDESSSPMTLNVTNESSSPVTLKATDESSSPMTLNATDESSSPVTLKATDESSSPVTLNATDESSSPMTLNATDESSSPVTLNVTNKSSSPVTLKATNESSSAMTLKATDESSSAMTLKATDESSSPVTLKATDESSSPVTLKATNESSSPVTLNATNESSSPVTLKATDESSSPVTLKATDESSSPVTLKATDESSPCHRHLSSADVGGRSQQVSWSGDNEDGVSTLSMGSLCSGSHYDRSGPITRHSDDQGAGHSLRDDVSQTDRKSQNVDVKCPSASCGGGATELHLDEPTCSAPPSQASQYINPLTPPSDSDSDTQEGGVTSDLPEVSSDDDAFATAPLRLPDPPTAPRYRNTFECGRRQSAPGQLVQDHGGSESELQSRRPGIAEYFSSRKQRSVSQSVPGWKLFGKVPPKQSPSKEARTIQQEFEARQVAVRSSPTHHAVGQQSRRKVEVEPLSTTALILEDRPPNLPAKSAEETQRHKQQYEQMVAGAKTRELKEAQRRRQQMKERVRQEEVISSATLVWNHDILPRWDAMKSSRKTRDLWWGGLPPSVRGRVWSLAIGNELNITTGLYEIFLSRAKERWRNLSEAETDDGAASSLELITRDTSRTLPSLCVFQKGGPYHDLLQSILGAYTCYRPDVGYVQGMSSMAAMLILNMDEAEVFISFSNLINRPCQLAFYRVDHQLMFRYFGAFQVFFQETLPHLFFHFRSSGVTPDLYLMDWILSLYMKPLPLDVACRVWDLFFRDGEEFLFRTALGILRLHQDVLLHMDLISIAQFLSRPPDDELLSDRLFSSIAATPMLIGNRKWTQVLSSCRDTGSSS